MPINFKFKLSKSHRILFIILIPLTIVSLLITFFTINYFKNKKDEIYNISSIDFSSLDMNRDFYHYDQIGYQTVIGVDLSEHNKEVDFKKLKDQGIEFVILRLGWRGYQNPIIHLDSRFEEYYKKAKEANIKVGVYFFSQAINEEETIEEANFVIETLKDKKIDMYVAYDCETIDDDKARTDDLSKHQTTLNARAFLNTISKEGYDPLLYTNLVWIRYHYDFQILSEYPIWYAQYSRNPQYKGKYIIWQYASEMIVDGISGEDGVDLNLMIIKEDIN